MSQKRRQVLIPQLSSTPRNFSKKNTLRGTNFSTPHVPIAGLGIERIDESNVS